jgi:hypothetical protein
MRSLATRRPPGGPIRRAVVDDHQLPTGVRLRKNALDRLAEKPRAGGIMMLSVQERNRW